MNPFAYNPSIIDFGWRTITTSRYHPKPDEWRTRLAVSDGGDIQYMLEFPQPYAEMSQEDARLFIYGGKLFISVTLSVFPGNPNSVIPCSQAYCELWKDSDGGWHVWDAKLPRYGNNNFQGQEKNWVFFEYENRLHFIYQLQPDQVVVPLENDGVTPLPPYRSESPKWNWGTMRGGTQPLPYKGKWLRFFHSLLQEGKSRAYWIYFTGALVMEPKPPFNILQVSKKPIFSGNEKFTDCPHWKSSVCIPYGAIPNGDGWTVALGRNDCECSYEQVTESMLNL